MPVDPEPKRSSLPALIPQGTYAKHPPIKLSRPVYVLGSKDRCRIHLTSSTVSSAHALLVQTRHLTYICDLCSRSHVFVNGKQIKEAILTDGDLIAIGKFTFKYQGPKKAHGEEPLPGPAALEVAGAELPIPIDTLTMMIGRRQICDIPLLEEAVSTTHAVIFSWEGKRFIRDLWSRTGTFVNGKSVHEQELKAGDRIRCGETDITYAPSLEEAAFSVIEGASDSIVAASPKADEVDLGLKMSPAPAAPAAQAPLEVIVPPMSPPRQEELLPLDEPLELIESAPHDTAHIPLKLEIEPEAPSAPQAAPAAGTDLPRRGWRAAIQEGGSEAVAPLDPHACRNPRRPHHHRRK